MAVGPGMVVRDMIPEGSAFRLPRYPLQIVLKLLVFGHAVSQGSVNAYGGGRVAHASKDLMYWRGRIATETQHATMKRRPIQSGHPIVVCAIFTDKKPIGMPKQRRDGSRVFRETMPDSDKLTRAAIDGLVDGGLILNDKQVNVQMGAKYFIGDPEPGVLDRPGMYVEVWSDAASA